MIENLLNEASHISPQGEKKNILHTELPPWLQCESSMVPDEYLYLWSLVQNTMNLADTQKVSQLLLTSGLHIDILGYIWNLANKTVPGQLTKQEFYIVLALVKLAQTGTAFNNLSILKLIPAPTVPILQVNIFKNQIVQPAAFSTTETSQLNCDQNSHNLTSLQPISISGIKETTPTSHLSTASSVANNLSNTTCDYNVLGKKKDSIKIEKSESNYGSEEGGQLSTSNAFHSDSYKSNFPCIGTSPTTELEDDFSEFQSVTAEKPNFSEPNDEFTDFQSANTETLENLDPFKTVVISQKREIPKIPLPKSFAGKLTNLKSNILKISPESERKLKVLSPNESLSSLPESKISSTNKVSTSISVLGSNHGVGSRLANHSFSKF